MPTCSGSSCPTQTTWTAYGYEEVPTAAVYASHPYGGVVHPPPPPTWTIPYPVVAPQVVAPWTYPWTYPWSAEGGESVQHRVEAGCVIDRMSKVCDKLEDSSSKSACTERLRDANLRGLNRIGPPASAIEHVADQSLVGCPVLTTTHDVHA